MSDLVQEFAKTTTFKYFYSTLMRFDVDLNCFVSTDKLRDRDAELLTAAWWMFQERQTKFYEMKAQLNNMEACYIEKKKQGEDAIYLKDEHRKRRCQLARELTRKSLRLTDAEFEYKRIKSERAKDVLTIMRLTTRNEKLQDDLKTLRGEHE